jgi:O-methyltransferase involved in polyketide biosynthesis
MKVEITKNGEIRMLQSDALDLTSLGKPEIIRASHVEFDNAKSAWYVQSARTLLILAEGFKTRSEALDWEKTWYSPGGPGWEELTTFSDT